MRLREAMDIIYGKMKGYMVSLEWIDGNILRSDHFPDKHAGEPLIPTECEAWELAERFARATKGRTCNLYVMDESFSPVDHYELRLIAKR